MPVNPDAGDPQKILIVDDNDLDVEIMEMQLRESGLLLTIDVCEDGEKASKYFSNRGHGVLLPAVVLLDINLPKKKGNEIFQEIKSNPETANVPVIIFSGPLKNSEVEKFQSFPNTICLQKPFLLAEYSPIIQTIKNSLRSNQ